MVFVISADMLDHCAACPEPFRYFRGKVYQLGAPKHMEYFWLCAHCAEFLDLTQTVDGLVHVVPKQNLAA